MFRFAALFILAFERCRFDWFAFFDVAADFGPCPTRLCLHVVFSFVPPVHRFSPRPDRPTNRPNTYTLQLPITIDAAFVEFVHTQSLEIHVWRGDRDEWPRAGTALGKAKIALRSLLVTLGGIGGDVNISPATGRGYRAGRVAVRLFFKHRGLGSRHEPALPGNGGEEKRGAQKNDASDGDGCERLPPALLQDDGSEPSERKDPCDSSPPFSSMRVPESATATSHQASEGASRAEPESRARGQPTAQLAGEAGGKLEVNIERAMRLLSTVPGDPEAGVSSEGSLPSTYVTFRWEEGGKPPLRPVLVLGEAISAGEQFDKGKDEQVRFDLSVAEALTTPVCDSRPLRVGFEQQCGCVWTGGVLYALD